MTDRVVAETRHHEADSTHAGTAGYERRVLIRCFSRESMPQKIQMDTGSGDIATCLASFEIFRFRSRSICSCVYAS